MCVKYPSHLVYNQNHRISFPYTTHFVFAIINTSILLFNIRPGIIGGRKAKCEINALKVMGTSLAAAFMMNFQRDAHSDT